MYIPQPIMVACLLACRRVLLALQQPAWCRTNHCDFPPAFQAAVQALLLLAAGGARRRRHQQDEPQGQQAVAGVGQPGCCLGDLPADVVERVLGLAAYPLSAWI